MAKEDKEITDMTILSQRDLPEFLELRVKMPRVHKLHWKDEKVSHELVRRIKVLRSSVVEPSNVTSACDKEMKLLGIQDTQSSDNQNSFHDMTSPCAVKNVVEKLSKIGDGVLEQEPIAQNTDSKYRSRKPDPLYVSLISQNYVPTTSLANSSETSFSECNFVAIKLMPEKKCAQEEEEEEEEEEEGEEHVTSSSVLFTVSPQENTAAKRKLSFEYIQEVSKLGVCN